MITKAEANEAFVRELQHRLGVTVDGWAGASTMTALDRVLLPAPFDPDAFYRTIKSQLFGGKMSQGQVDGVNAIIAGFRQQPLSWTAYALATAYHEVDKTMQPIREYGKGSGRKYGAPGRNGGQVAYGRGLVQLTWDGNYERADRELGLNGTLVKDYDLALSPEVAVSIMRSGMVGGWFTGKGFKDYLPAFGPASRDAFRSARRIINGTDKADLIAGYALTFQSALQSGGWK